MIRKTMPAGRQANRERVLDFLGAYILKHGYPPTRREIADGCGFYSVSAAQYHLSALERAGYIKLAPGKKARGIVILPKPLPGPGLPACGSGRRAGRQAS